MSDLKKRLFDPDRRKAIDIKYAIHHVSHRNWDLIPKKYWTMVNYGPVEDVV